MIKLQTIWIAMEIIHLSVHLLIIRDLLQLLFKDLIIDQHLQVYSYLLLEWKHVNICLLGETVSVSWSSFFSLNIYLNWGAESSYRVNGIHAIEKSIEDERRRERERRPSKKSGVFNVSFHSIYWNYETIFFSTFDIVKNVGTVIIVEYLFILQSA